MSEYDYAIWWTTQADVDAINIHFGGDLALPSWCPRYLRDEFASRLGHPGRGRLWISDQLPVSAAARFDDEVGSPLQSHCERAAGIVIRRADIRTLAHLPGIVTDFDLVRVA